MNKARREELLDVATTLGEALDRLEEIRDDEQESFDNLPEGLQCSSRGESMQEALDQMDEWYDKIADIQSEIENYSS